MTYQRNQKFENVRYEYDFRNLSYEDKMFSWNQRKRFVRTMQTEAKGWTYDYVYACLDEDDNYLYIGCTYDLDQRLGQHRGSKDWWGEVRSIVFEIVKSEGESCPKPSHLKETELIERFRPKYNKTISGKRNKYPDLPVKEIKWM